MLLRRAALLLAAALLLMAVPPSLLDAQEATVYDVALEQRQRAFPSDARRSMLAQALEVSDVSLTAQTVNQVLELFEADPAVAIVLVDHQSGEIIPASRRGSASLSIGPPTDVPARCGGACADFRNPRSLKLEKATTTVSAPGIGDVQVRMLGNVDAGGAVDPATGRVYVEWPVLLRVPKGDMFERKFTTRAVFRGFGQMSGSSLQVVDVARLDLPGDRTLDVIASHSVELPDG